MLHKLSVENAASIMLQKLLAIKDPSINNLVEVAARK